MSVGGLGATLAFLLPRFSDVWSIPPREGAAVGRSWELAIASVPEGERPAGLLRALEGLPWVNAIATTALVLFPRFTFTIKNLRRPGAQWNAPPEQTAGEPIAEQQPPEQQAPAPPPRDPSQGFPSAYAGERNGEYGAIDGSDVGAAAS